MSLPLDSQTEYPLSVEVPTYSINKCNWCVIAKDMPNILSKSEGMIPDAVSSVVSSATSAAKSALDDPIKSLPAVKVAPHLRLFIILVFMMILYVIIVGYIASYKPHNEPRPQ
jgi:hypothetical protein